MTQQKYKVGDEVLIRAKIIEMANYHEGNRYGYEFSFDNGYTILGSKKHIYSLAPEFEIGEEIEVTDKGRLTWSSDIFAGYVANSESPYICLRYHWQLARKIQPQVIDKEEDITVIRDGKKYKLVEIES